ncbi:MAG: hypothetical protein ACXVRV_05630 [Gaiellaceae bacterium]
MEATATREVSFVLSHPGSGVYYPESFALQTPGSYQGPVSVTVTAVDDVGVRLASGSAATVAQPSRRSDVRVDLLGTRIVDGGIIDAGGGLDGGVPGGRGPGERCDVNDRCMFGLLCGGYAAGAHYCLYSCNVTDMADYCPLQTQCMIPPDEVGPMLGSACVYVSMSDAAAKPVGATCSPTSDHCEGGYICGGATCDQQCNGPGAAGCISGTCRPLNDPIRPLTVIAYTCQP